VLTTCQDSYRPGGRVPTGREESFPERWDAVPVGLLHLIDESACTRVQAFAVKALEANRAFCDQLDDGVVAMILGRPFEVCADFGCRLVRRRYDPNAPQVPLLVAMVHSVSAVARSQAMHWIAEQGARFVTDGDLLVGLATAQHNDVRQRLAELLRVHAIPETTAQAVLGRLVAHLVGLTSGDGASAKGLGEVLIAGFARYLGRLDGSVIRDLLYHPLVDVQEIGADLLLNHPTLGHSPPDDLLQALLMSHHDRIQSLGMRLVDRLSDEAMAKRAGLVAALLAHRAGPLRDRGRTRAQRLMVLDETFGARLVDAIVVTLLRRHHRLAEGVVGALVSYVRQELKDHLDQVAANVVWSLLNSKNSAVQELGGVLLPLRIDPDTVELERLVTLANHEVLAVREAAWAMCRQSPERLGGAMMTATRLLESDWADTRHFAQQFLGSEAFGEEAWSTAVLIATCDSVREEVQRFGQRQIQRFFRDEHGPEYLLKLSEHPAPSLHLFVTHYLERYASGQVERLVELEPYFVTVLSTINRGRLAKQRVLDFLAQEAEGSEAAARVVAPMLTRLSATIAVGDRAAAIAALTQIERRWPEVSTPLTVVEPEARPGRQGMSHGV
ncbi:MAG: hypothetical protein AAFX99_15190, partial [Myxococcota bacterium]